MSERNKDPSDPTSVPMALKKKKNKTRKEYVKDPPFEGDIKDLRGKIYDTGGNAKDRFATTTRAIPEYVARTYKNAGEFSNALDPDDLGFPPIRYPPDPDPNANRVVIKKWEKEYDIARTKERQRELVSGQAFSVVLSQCSKNVRDRIEAHHTYAGIKQDLDVINLLQLIRHSLYTGATTKKHVHACQEALESLFTYYQGYHMSNHTYF